jgi:hypothetical protein
MRSLFGRYAIKWNDADFVIVAAFIFYALSFAIAQQVLFENPSREDMTRLGLTLAAIEGGLVGIGYGVVSMLRIRRIRNQEKAVATTLLVKNQLISVEQLRNHPYGSFLSTVYDRLVREFSSRIEIKCLVPKNWDYGRAEGPADLIVVHSGGVDCILVRDLSGPLVGDPTDEQWSFYQPNGTLTYKRIDASWSSQVRKQVCANPWIVNANRMERLSSLNLMHLCSVVLYSDAMNVTLKSYLRNPEGVLFLDEYIDQIKQSEIRLNPFDIQTEANKIK